MGQCLPSESPHRPLTSLGTDCHSKTFPELSRKAVRCSFRDSHNHCFSRELSAYCFFPGVISLLWITNVLVVLGNGTSQRVAPCQRKATAYTHTVAAPFSLVSFILSQFNSTSVLFFSVFFFNSLFPSLFSYSYILK